MHKTQWQVFKDTSRFKVVVCGRRWGKSRLQSISVFYRCLQFSEQISKLTPETIVVVMPTLVMAKRVLWKPIVSLFEVIPGVKINISDRRISVPGKPDIIVAGAENYDALRGLRIYYAAIDEFQDCPPNFLDSVIRPAMADTLNSSALITGTPKGINNHFYDLAMSPFVKYFTFHTSTNPYINKSEIEYAKKTLSPKLFQQEFEADWVNFGGAIYSELTPNHLYSTLEGIRFERFFAGVDWGDVNPAFVIVGMTADKSFYVLEANKIGDGTNVVAINTFYEQLAKACRRYDVHRVYCDPSRPSNITDLRAIGKRENIPGLLRAIAGNNKIVPGNSLVNNLLFQYRLFLPQTDKAFYDEMASYSRKTIRGTNTFYEDKIEDGQKDHKIDALRYCLFTLLEKEKTTRVLL